MQQMLKQKTGRTWCITTLLRVLILATPLQGSCLKSDSDEHLFLLTFNKAMASAQLTSHAEQNAQPSSGRTTQTLLFKSRRKNNSRVQLPWSLVRTNLATSTVSTLTNLSASDSIILWLTTSLMEPWISLARKLHSKPWSTMVTALSIMFHLSLSNIDACQEPQTEQSLTLMNNFKVCYEVE